MKSLCKTRWVSRHDVILLFCTELTNIVMALEIIVSWSDGESSSKAITLMHAVCCLDFIVTIFCLRDVLSVTLPISKKLQQVHIEFVDAANTVSDATV